MFWGVWLPSVQAMERSVATRHETPLFRQLCEPVRTSAIGRFSCLWVLSRDSVLPLQSYYGNPQKNFLWRQGASVLIIDCQLSLAPI